MCNVCYSNALVVASCPSSSGSVHVYSLNEDPYTHLIKDKQNSGIYTNTKKKVCYWLEGKLLYL